jgi:hypothetical protein
MTTVSVHSRHDAPTNPLDILEELVSAHEWEYERSSDSEMLVEVRGQWCDYRIHTFWHEELSGLHFSCLMDMKIPVHKRSEVYDLLAAINQQMWVGHFDACSEEGVPSFRHTVLLRGAAGASVEQLEDLVDIAVSECERYYPAFQFVVWGGKSSSDALASALLDTVGEA